MINNDISFYQNLRREYRGSISWPLLIFGLILILMPLNAIAASANIPESDLLKKYAPVLYFHPEEKVYPWGIDSMLSNADLKKLRNNRKAQMPLSPKALLSNNSDKLYLDLRNIVPYYNAVSALNSSNKTFEKFPFRVYGRQVDPQKNSTYIVLQYWLFYPFNQWHNDHEGDWELVQIRYAKDRHAPDQLTTSHHHSGTVIAWDKVSKIKGTHPKIFIAKGGHGNWPTSGNHAVGKIWRKVGIFRDKTSENGMVLYPGYILDNVSGKKRKYILEDISDLPRSSWIYWNGRWGDVKVLFWGSKGPESPGVQDKWKNPIKWGNKPAKSSFWVYFGSPGVLHIYDPHGNHVGLTEKGQKDTIDKVEGNIPGTYFYVPSSDAIPQDCAWINTSEDLRFEIKATQTGNFDFSFDFDPGAAGQSEEKIAISVIYNDIKIAKGGTAKINVPSAKLSKRLEAIMTDTPIKEKGPGSEELESTELELENMANKTRLYLKQKPKKNVSDILEEELAELEAMLKDGSIERSMNKRSADEADLNLAELELENMAEIARLSKKLIRKKGIDLADEELAEIEDSLQGAHLLERLLKPILIMKIDLDGDGTVDEFRQPDKISWMKM
jgi:Vacuolar protein sorting-associated protein 62